MQGWKSPGVNQAIWTWLSTRNEDRSRNGRDRDPGEIGLWPRPLCVVNGGGLILEGGGGNTDSVYSLAGARYSHTCVGESV